MSRTLSSGDFMNTWVFAFIKEQSLTNRGTYIRCYIWNGDRREFKEIKGEEIKYMMEK